MAYSSDIFGAATQQNLKTGGDGAKAYNWFAKNTANADNVDVNISNAGRMTINCNAVASEIGATSVTTPMAYQVVDGDFDFSTFIIDNNDGNYEGAGIAVFSTGNINLHAYIVQYLAGGHNIACRDSDGASESVIGSDAAVAHHYFRITRVGDLFTFYRKANAGDAWTEHGSVTHALGASVWVALFAMTNNTSDNYVAQFDYLLFLSTIEFYRDEFYDPVAAGGTGGVPSDNLTLGPVERLDASVSNPQRCAVRLVSGTKDVTLTPAGSTSALFALSVDNVTWGNYGDPLVLSSVAQTNKEFYIRCKGAVGDSFGPDIYTMLVCSAAAAAGLPVVMTRKVVPTFGVLGSAGGYFLGIDWGSGVYWKHNASSPGDCGLFVAGGSSFVDVVYNSSSVSGETTTFEEKTLESGLTVATKSRRVRPGLFLVTMTLTSANDKWMAFNKYLRGSTVTTSTVLEHKTAAVRNADTCPFQAAGMHHANGTMAALIAGNGWENDWCLYSYDYLANTSWYNTSICAKSSIDIVLAYGYLKNGSSSDYTLRLQAGVPRDITYIVCTDISTTQNQFNEIVHSGYHDAHSSVAFRNRAEKLLWATAHQMCIRIKRHILVEGAKRLWMIPQEKYGPLMTGDAAYLIMGLGEPSLVTAALETFHNLGAPDGLAATSACWASGGNTMDGSNPRYEPSLELYAKNFLDYVPDATALAEYLATANAYADAINNVKLLSDTATKKAHLASNIFGGNEAIGFGNFEEDLSFPQANETRYRWTADNTGAGTATRVTTDPYEGTHHARLYTANGSDVGRLKLMRIAVPPSKTCTATAMVKIGSVFGTGGFRFNIVELKSDLTSAANHQSGYTAVTTGYEQKSYEFTLNANTCYLIIAIEASGGAGTAYVDDVQCTMAAPAYAGLFYTLSTMPPQVKADTISPGMYGLVWAQLNMNCLKALLGAAWTIDHQACLDNINAVFPAAFWTDGSHIKIKDDLYHHRRSGWLNSWVLWSHYIWFILSGTKILSDGDVASIVANYPSTAVGYSYGNVAFKGWVCHTDGSAILGAERTEMLLGVCQYAEGVYINGGSWLWAGDAFFNTSAYWAGVADSKLNLYRRLQIEIERDYQAHEWITTGPTETYYQTADPGSFGCGDGVIILANTMVLTRSNVTAVGCDLDWTGYLGDDFVSYEVCRSVDSPVLITDDIETITNQATLEFTDDTAADDTAYFYAIFAVKEDGSTVKSNEVFLTTEEGAAIKTNYYRSLLQGAF